jgi:hemerythrin-like domain-containing protein
LLARSNFQKDHKTVLALIDELISTENKNPELRSELLDKIRDELIPHSRAEEAILYNFIRDLGQEKANVTRSYAEHVEAEALLRALQVSGAVHLNWTSAAKKLREALSAHIEEEETKIFKVAQEVFTDEEVQEMAKAFNRLKPAIRDQSFLGNSMDLVVNLLPARLRKTFAKFAAPQAKSA